MAGKLKQKSFRDWSKGNWQNAQNSVVPQNSCKLGLNLDSDDEIGSMVSRLGTTIVGSQLVNDKPILGLHNYRNSLTTGNKLFAVISDGSYSDIYDVVAGTKSLENDTKDLKTRFLTYLNACLRLNGTDAPKWWNGTSWKSSATGANFTADAGTDFITSNAHGLLNGDVITVSSSTTLPVGLTASTLYYVIEKTDNTFKVSLTPGGTAVNITDTGTGTHTWANWNPFDVANLPSGAKYAIEFKDRVHTCGFANNPDRVDISGIANSTTKTVSWTSGNRFMMLEQEDGGGGIRAIAKVPSYVLYFKRRTMKKYDGSSAYPEDLVNEGVYSQECVVMAQGMCFFVNENGAWATEGGRPKNISTYTVEKILKSLSAANWDKVASGTDEKHIFWSFSSVTMDGETYSNIVLKYNILQNTWDIRQYPTNHRFYAKYVDTNDSTFLVCGDDDGSVRKLDTGNDDDGTAITWAFETWDIDFGLRTPLKGIGRIGVFTENVSDGLFLWRNTHNIADWEKVGDGIINKEVSDIDDLDLRGNYYNFKMTGTTDSGQIKILGFEVPEEIEVYDNSE